MDKKKVNEFFIKACEKQDLEEIKFYLTSSQLKNHTDINIEDGLPLWMACTKGNLNIVKYLLTSPELSNHADIHQNNDNAYAVACAAGRMDIVVYLTNSPELKSHPYNHHSHDVFLLACKNFREEVMKFFLYDLNLETSNIFKNKLKDEFSDNAEQYKKIINLIEKKDLFFKIEKSLNDELNVSEKQVEKKHKI